MPLSTKCKFGGKVITVEEALRLRKAGHRDFTCVVCGHTVRPNSQSAPGKKYQAAQIYHPKSDGGRSTHCPLSDTKVSV